MKKFFRFVARSILVIFLLVLIFSTGVWIFTITAPQFGQPPQEADLERIKKSPNYSNGQFKNPIKTRLGSFSDMMSTLPEFIFGKNLEPSDSLPVKYGLNRQLPSDSTCFVTWYGHSAFLIELEGSRILIDPMLTDTPAPVTFGTSRFSNQEPVPLSELKDIDYVILSHDHYDHLDYRSILALKENTGHFYTALGVGSHLKKWGIPDTMITELDWWEEAYMDNFTFAACPARHFSGRGIMDRNKTQWASWVIRGNHFNLYFSGDGGYGPHFREIGDTYGPFDLALLECGQYNTAWQDIHMMPEESVQAGIDVKATVLMPVHWGAFALSVHDWKEPVKRFITAAREQSVPVIHPYIGERFQPGVDFPVVNWWNNLK